MERTCEWCSKTFEAWKGWKANRFCSQACYHAWRPGHSRGELADQRPVEERTCPACARVFLVGGRGNRMRSAQCCSPECASKAKYRHGAIARMLTTAEAAYLAGLIDGEGSIMLYMRRDVVAMMVTVTNTHVGLLNWVRDVTQVGAVCRQYAETSQRKASGFWRCNAEAAAGLLVQVQPYLIIKGRQCALALDTQARLADPALKADRSWHAEYHRRMKALNHRGPATVDITLAAGS